MGPNKIRLIILDGESENKVTAESVSFVFARSNSTYQTPTFYLTSKIYTHVNMHHTILYTASYNFYCKHLKDVDYNKVAPMYHFLLEHSLRILVIQSTWFLILLPLFLS